MERYIVVAGNPFTGYTGTVTFTSLNIVDKDDDLEAIRAKIPEMYEEYAGLLVVIDTHTNTIVDG